MQLNVIDTISALMVSYELLFVALCEKAFV